MRYRALTVIALVSALACSGKVDGDTNRGGDPPGGGDSPTGGDNPNGGDTPGGPATTTALARTANTTCSLGTSTHLDTAFDGAGDNVLTGLVPVPGGNGYLALSQQNGVVKVFDSHNYDVNNVNVALDVSAKVYFDGAEKGFHSVAFAPDFATSGIMYVMYSIENSGAADDHNSRVEQYACTRDNGLTCDPSSANTIIEIERPSDEGNHNGGQLFFGGDGLLYITMGDSGGGGDPQGWAQDVNRLEGKLLRIDPSHGDGTNNYTIPADNPFATSGGAPEIFAYGFRNPWRASYDSVSDRIFVGDVGQDVWEEIDILQKGQNFGWNTLEGTHPYPPGSDNACDTCIPPIYEYDHEAGRIAIVGGFIYRGTVSPNLYGAYIFADYGTGETWRLDENTSNHTWASTALIATGSPLTSFGLDDTGEIYALHYDGSIQHIAVSPGGDDTIPATISATGCYSDVNTQTLAAGIVPYDIRVPFWSDGETKHRFILVPGSATIDATLQDEWSFPIGTIFVKEFDADGGIIETRFLVHASADTWNGYSYRWNDDRTDATLQPDSEETDSYTLNSQPHDHIFPSRSECNECHTANGGFVLGFRTQQLNTTHDYGGGPENEVEAFGIAGYLTARLSGQSSDWPALAVTDDTTASLGDRARSYLAANCSQCHSGTDNGGRFPDMRYKTALADTKLCTGVASGPDITPGDAADSTIIKKAGVRGAGQMPPLATLVVDADGIQLLSDWINAMTASPATLTSDFVCPAP